MKIYTSHIIDENGTQITASLDGEQLKISPIENDNFREIFIYDGAANLIAQLVSGGVGESFFTFEKAGDTILAKASSGGTIKLLQGFFLSKTSQNSLTGEDIPVSTNDSRTIAEAIGQSETNISDLLARVVELEIDSAEHSQAIAAIQTALAGVASITAIKQTTTATAIPTTDTPLSFASPVLIKSQGTKIRISPNNPHIIILENSNSSDGLIDLGLNSGTQATNATNTNIFVGLWEAPDDTTIAGGVQVGSYLESTITGGNNAITNSLFATLYTIPANTTKYLYLTLKASQANASSLTTILTLKGDSMANSPTPPVINGTFTPNSNVEVVFENVIQEGDVVYGFIHVRALAVTSSLGTLSGVHTSDTAVPAMGRVWVGTSVSGASNLMVSIASYGIDLIGESLNINAEFRFYFSYHTNIV